ncbi:hypothetical protein FNS61_22580 [Salmonella enterica]|nr:hypothetical protein [Salmonella enterica]
MVSVTGTSCGGLVRCGVCPVVFPEPVVQGSQFSVDNFSFPVEEFSSVSSVQKPTALTPE